MNDHSAELLASAIVEQAVLDYRELVKKGKEEIKPFYRGSFSRSEIDQFFHGEWCKTILRGIGSRVDGVSILRQLKSEA